jgi:hypothetical protein
MSHLESVHSASLRQLAKSPARTHVPIMLNLLSLLTGAVALLIALIGILPIPLLPLVNWIAFPIAVVGLVLGVLSSGTAGRNLNIVVLVISGLRLFLTGGLI